MVIEEIETKKTNGKFVAKNLKAPINMEKVCCKMIVKGKYSYQYLALNLRAKVVVRFRKFSKKIAGSHSDTIVAMLDFFEWHGYTPYQRFGQDIIEGQKKNRKRIEAVIAIIKDIEKNHDKPTTAMLQSLFQGVVEKEEPIRKEKLFKDQPKVEKKQVENTVSKIKHERTERKLQEVRKEFEYLLEHIELVNNRFGSDYLKLELSQQEFIRIKRELENY